MTFEVGRLSAALTLDGVDQFNREIDNVGRKLQETDGRSSAFGRGVSSAFRTAAGVTTALTTAAGAYLTILTKTGVSYNSMQQNSRSALQVILGGAEKANEQMAKLDDFARNSPFSKSTFIQAQQQLLGFGMEASKVIPTLDAIQQAMAAMGRSNQDISEVVNILAQVQSTGKLTAETLNQLGVRGVDAADLIGKGMNKTGNEIRTSITKGTLDGRKALDILVQEMGTKFAGAADGVKQNWDGAVDRIKAANRDLGSAIAEPFVSAQGGGMAVTWANQVADVLRAIQRQATPVMNILTQRGMPFFTDLEYGLDRTKQAINRWNPERLDKALSDLSGHAPALAATAGALLAVGAQAGPLGRLLSTLGLSANPAVAAFVGLAAASPEVRDGVKAIFEAGKPLVPVIGDLAKTLSGQLNSALPLVSSGAELFANVLGVALNVLEKIPTPVLIGAAAFLTMQKGLKTVEGPLGSVLGLLQGFGQRAAVQAALGDTNVLIGGLSAASMGAKGAVKGLGDALKGAFITNPIGIALTVVAGAISLWATANAKAQQEVQEHNDRVKGLKDTLNETSGALTAASKAQVEKNLADTEAYDLADKLGIKQRDITSAVLGNEEAYQRVTAAMEEHIAATTTGDKNLDTWSKTATDAKMNVKALTEILEEQSRAVEEAQVLKQALIQADREAAAAMSDAARSNQRFNDALEVARDITQDAETRVRALKQALDELKGGVISAEEAEKRLSETNLTLAEGLAQTDENGTKLWASMLDGAGKIDLSSRAGLAFADSMGQARDRMLDAAMAAADQALEHNDLVGAVTASREAGEKYIGTLRKTMEEAGLTESQIEGLIGSYLDVPGVVSTLLTDNGSIGVVDQKLLELALRINATPDKQITVTEPMSPQIIKRLENLGYKVKTLPNGHVQVTESGSSSVERTIANIVRPRTVWIDVRANDPNNMYGRADGGLHSFSGNQIVEQFANGGFPTGIYKGGPPIFKFAEPETGWEAFISGKPGQEARNARIAMEALRRLGQPVVPLSALHGVTAFADGGMLGNRAPQPVASHAHQGSNVTNWNMTIVNPVVRDDLQEALDAADLKGGL